MCHGQIIGSAVQKARSERKPCACCARPIRVGDEYVMHKVQEYEENTLGMWKLCKTCASWWEEHYDGNCDLDMREAMVEDARSMGREFRALLARGWARLTRHTKGGAET